MDVLIRMAGPFGGTAVTTQAAFDGFWSAKGYTSLGPVESYQPTGDGPEVPAWTANVLYAQGQIAADPATGALMRRATSGISRGTFDTTEQTAWVEATSGGGGGGTFAPLALPTGITAAGRFDPNTGIYVPAGSDRAALIGKIARADNGDILMRIGDVGDSTTAGAYAGSKAKSPPGVMRARMLAAGHNVVGTGWSLIAETLAADSRWTLAGSWNRFGLAVAGATSGATATWTSDQPGTVMELCYYDGSGTLNWSIDSGAGGTGTIVCANSGLYKTVVLASGLVNATHKVDFTVTLSAGGYPQLVAMSCRPTTGLVIDNLGFSGTTALNWNGIGAGGLGGAQSFKNLLAVLAPDHTHVRLGINDYAAATDATTFQTSLNQIVADRKTAGGSVTLATPNPFAPFGSGSGSYTPWQQAAYAVADAQSVPLIDHTYRWGSVAEATALGLYASGPHPDAAGYADLGSTEAAFLRPGLAPGLTRSAIAASGVLPADVGASAQLVRTATKIAAYNAQPGDLIPVDTATPNADVQVNLPTNVAIGARIAVKHIAVGAGKVARIVCTGTDVFNKAGGGTTLTLPLLNQAMGLQYDAGGIWTVISDDLTKSALDLLYVPMPPVGTGAGTVPTAQGDGTIVYSLPSGGGSGMQLAVDETVHATAFPAAANTMHAVDLSSANVLATLPSNPADHATVLIYVKAWASHALTVQPGAGDRYENGALSFTGAFQTAHNYVANDQFTQGGNVWLVAGSFTSVGAFPGWIASHAYSVGDVILAANGTDLRKVTTAYTSGLTEGGTDNTNSTIVASVSTATNPMTRSKGAGQSIWLAFDASIRTWRELPDRLPIAVLNTMFSQILVEQALQTSDPAPANTGGHWPFNLTSGSKNLTLPLGTAAMDGLLIGAEIQAGWGYGRWLHVVASGVDAFETAATGQDWYLRGAHEKIIWQYRWASKSWVIIAAYKDRADLTAALTEQGAWASGTIYYSGAVVTANGGRYVYPTDNTVAGASIAADVAAGKAVFLGVDTSAVATLPANAQGAFYNDGSGTFTYRPLVCVPTAIKVFADSPVTATPNDMVPVDTTAGAVQVVLPYQPPDRTLVEVDWHAGSTSNPVSVVVGTGGSGADIIGDTGVSTDTLSLLYTKRRYQYQASSGRWWTKSAFSLSQLDGRFASSASVTALAATTTIDLVDRNDNTTETVPAGTTTNCATAGVTKTAPAPAGSVGTPPQRFAIRNSSTGSITISYPDPAGVTQTVTLLSGGVQTYRQKTASGYAQESGYRALTQDDQRYQKRTRPSSPPNTIAETLAFEVAIGNETLALTSGTAKGALIDLVAGDVITNMVWESGGTAMVTPSHQWAALLTTAGIVVAVSADDTAGSWNARTAKPFAVAGGPFTVTATGKYYLIKCVVATTTPSAIGATGGIATYMTQVSPARTFSLAGQSTPPTVGATLSTAGSATSLDYGYVN